MYKSRIILGAFASASVLATAVAGPALAGTSRTGVNGPVVGSPVLGSPVVNVAGTRPDAPGGASSLSGVTSGLSKVPLAGIVAGETQGVASGNGMPSGTGAVGNAMPQLGAVASDLSQASVPGLSAVGGAQNVAKGGSPSAVTAGLTPASNDIGTLTGDLEALPGVGPLTSELGAINVG